MNQKFDPQSTELHGYLRRKDVAEYVAAKVLTDPVQRLEMEFPVEVVRDVVMRLREDVQVLLESLVGTVEYKQFLDPKRYAFLARSNGPTDVAMTSQMLARTLTGLGMGRVVELPDSNHALIVHEGVLSPEYRTKRSNYQNGERHDGK